MGGGSCTQAGGRNGEGLQARGWGRDLQMKSLTPPLTPSLVH